MEEILKDKNINFIMNKIKNIDDISVKELGYIANIYININNLNNYVNNLLLGSRIQYDLMEENIFLATEGCEVVERAKQTYNKNGFNQLLIFSVFHELRHVEQSKILFEFPEKENSSKIKTLLYNERYRTFGLLVNKMMIEYDANIYALYNMSIIFKEFEIDFDQKFLSEQISKILRAYEDNCSVVENNLKCIDKRFWEDYINDYQINIKHDFSKCESAFEHGNKKKHKLKNDVITRLLDGEKLTTNELEVLKKIESGEMKTNDIFETLLKLNEKIKSPFTMPTIEKGQIKDLYTGRKK